MIGKGFRRTLFALLEFQTDQSRKNRLLILTWKLIFLSSFFSQDYKSTYCYAHPVHAIWPGF